jgi:hypothetical protein
MGMPVQETPIALDAGHGPRHGAPRVRGDLEDVLEGLIGGTRELGEAAPGPSKIWAQPPRERQDHMPMGHRLENLVRDELAEFDLALLVAGRAEAAALTGEGQQILVATP